DPHRSGEARLCLSKPRRRGGYRQWLARLGPANLRPPARHVRAGAVGPGLARTPNLTAIDHYLSLQYVPAPETAFTGIFRVPAAHYLAVSPDPQGRWPGMELVRDW